MTKPFRALVAAFVVFGSLFMGVGPADAASGRIVASSIGMNAPVKHVGVKNGRLQIGSNLHTVYTKRGGDPPCDQSGSTMYAGHAWQSGNGVADKWLQLERGDVIRVAGCKFKVIKKEVWDDGRKVGSLSRPDGPPLINLYGCKADDYDFATVVTARKLGKNTPF